MAKGHPFWLAMAPHDFLNCAGWLGQIASHGASASMDSVLAVIAIKPSLIAQALFAGLHELFFLSIKHLAI